MKAALFFLALFLLAGSCTTLETCEEDGVSEMVARFKTETDGVLSDTSISNLRIYGIREDQPIWFLYDSVETNEILLPLDPQHDFSRFVFMANGFSDTLTLSHSSEDYLIDYACGFGKIFELEPDPDYGGGMIKGDSLIFPTVTTTYYDDEIHLWLYF